MTAKDKPVSKPASDEYRSNYDKIFGGRMKTYAVVVRATITKTILVDANSKAEATEQAHQEFSVLCDGEDEDYEEETLSVAEMEL